MGTYVLVHSSESPSPQRAGRTSYPTPAESGKVILSPNETARPTLVVVATCHREHLLSAIPPKADFAQSYATSALCQQRTYDVYSITSSAIASSAEGMKSPSALAVR